MGVRWKAPGAVLRVLAGLSAARVLISHRSCSALQGVFTASWFSQPRRSGKASNLQNPAPEAVRFLPSVSSSVQLGSLRLAEACPPAGRLVWSGLGDSDVWVVLLPCSNS